MGKKNKNKKLNIDSTSVDTNGGSKVITDSRFAKVHTDPRFQKAPKRKAKVVIDSRFNRMFTDERFSSSSALLDKRGKHKKRPENALSRYYRVEEDAGELDKREIEKDEEDEGERKGRLERDVDGDGGSEEELENSKGDLSDLDFSDELELSEEEDEDVHTDDTVSTSDTDDEVDDVDLGEDAFVEAENVPEIEKETHRLAVVNMDWNQVKAVDLFMLLSSFLPKGGQILHVAVYPSEFGLQRMEEEAVHGPVGLFGDGKKNDSDDDDEDEDEIDNEKLRAYEKSRLKYYFAVVECDSVATADYLYKNCDGVELERSANKLDLRFIPDSMEFKHPPRDVAKDLPTNYEPLDFQTRALQHSNILLSWDDDEPHRAKTLKRKLTADQLDKLELEEFLASTESDDDEDEDGNDTEDLSGKKSKKRDMYRALIQGGGGSDDDEEEGQDMEVTFNTGLEDISKKILEKKDKKLETVWEAYLKKRKEKRKGRKNRSKNSSDDESDYSDQQPMDDPDDFFEEDTTVERKKSGGKKDAEKNKDVERDREAEASMAELELLLADDKGADNNVKGYKIKPKTAKGKKKKNGTEVPTEEKLPTVDVEDPRFSGLFSNPLFALDPTDPQFKRSATYARQLAQQQQKGREEQTEEEPEKRDHKAPLEPNYYEKNKEERSRPDASSSKDKHELSSLVKSIKMKSKQIVPSDGSKKQGKMKLNGEKRKKHDSLVSSSKKKAKV